MNRNFFLRTLIAASALLVAHFVSAKEFSLESWYPPVNYKITDADDCGTIKLVTCSFSGWSPAQIVIYEKQPDGSLKNLTRADLSIEKSNFSFNKLGDDGVIESFKIEKNLSSEGWSESFYINTRNYPYVITDVLPTDTFNAARLTSSAVLLTTPGQPFKLTGKACTNVDSCGLIAGIYKISGLGRFVPIVRNQDTLTLTQKEDTLYYRYEATFTYPETDSTEEVDHTVFSDVVGVFYKQPTATLSATAGTSAHRFNDYEFEVKEGGSVNFNANTVGFDGDVTYTLQYKELEGIGLELAEWKDMELMTDGKLTDFKPTIAAQYRVKAKGKSAYSGNSKEIYSEKFIAVRIIHTADSEKYDIEELWKDDFGHFNSATSYIDASGVTYTSSFTDSTGVTYPIENFWAPDCNGYIKEHKYASLDPNFKNNTRDWCSKYRLEDGYYIITTNPIKGDGKNNYADRDYWDATDHTGDDNGAMLFVNCAAERENTVIYERDIYLNCTMNDARGTRLVFSSYVNNAVYKTGSETPVNLRWELLDENGRAVYSVESGDVHQRKGSLNKDSWANLSFSFLGRSSKYTLRLYNNSPGGASYGNDILLDDISVTLCYPKVEVKAEVSKACAGEIFQMKAFNEDGIENFIYPALFQFQYRNELTGGEWKNYQPERGVMSDSIIYVNVVDSLMGETSFRVITANSEELIREIVSGNAPTRGCSSVYAVSDPVTISHGKQYSMIIDLSEKEFCMGDAEVLAKATPDYAAAHPTQYYWFYGEKDGVMTVIDSTVADSFLYEQSDTVFNVSGEYVLMVEAIDTVCQTTLPSIQIYSPEAMDTVIVNPRNRLRLTLECDSVLNYGAEASFSIDNDGYDGDSLIWNENGGVKKTFSIGNVASHSFVPDQNGTVCYHLTAPAEYVCADPSDTVCLNVNLVIPNLITPHNDGSAEMNNTFLLGRGFHVEIFNRYQQLIYEGEDGWDATFKGKTAEPGTYFYRVFLPNGEIKKGTLEVAKFK